MTKFCSGDLRPSHYETPIYATLIERRYRKRRKS
jgi:hypothetical protein